MEAVCILDFEQQEQERKESKAPARFHEYYGVWFHGLLRGVIRQFACERFGQDLGKRMHVFIEPERIEKDGPVLSDGIHEVTVYGHLCRLYKWVADGYHRGLVVLADDEQGNAEAQVFFEIRSWSLMMKAADKARLAEIMGQQH